MKKYLLILGLFIFSYSQIVFANDAYSGFINLDSYHATQTKCINASIQAGKKSGIYNMAKKGTNGLYSYGSNKNSYSISFLCIKDKNIAFIVINGSSFYEQKKLYKIFEGEFKKNLLNK